MLYDQNGRVVSSARFRGKQIMLNFIYSRCPVANMCPLSTAKMMAAQKLARESGVRDIEFVSITMDPAYDTPGVLRDYADQRGIDTVQLLLPDGPRGGDPGSADAVRRDRGVQGGHPRPHAGDAPHRREGPDRVEGRRERLGAEGVRGADAPVTDGGDTPRVGVREWRQIAAITASAILFFLVVRELPTGTNLSHMDFRVQGANTIEFCDPANPQFLPVVAVRSPVSLTVSTPSPPRAGSEVAATLVLTTFSGKPIAPEDLQVVQTRRIHLLIVDPSLDDYQHVHPVPGRRPGEWEFSFRPRFGGAYRIFADFTPVATNRGLYSETEMGVAGEPSPVAAGSQAPSSWKDRLPEHHSPLREAPPIPKTWLLYSAPTMSFPC